VAAHQRLHRCNINVTARRGVRGVAASGYRRSDDSISVKSSGSRKIISGGDMAHQNRAGIKRHNNAIMKTAAVIAKINIKYVKPYKQNNIVAWRGGKITATSGIDVSYISWHGGVAAACVTRAY